MNKIAFLALSVAFLIFAMPVSKYYNYVLLVLFIVLDCYMLYKKDSVNRNYTRWMVSFLFICFVSLWWSISFKYSFYIIHNSLLPLFSISFFIVIFCRNADGLRVVLSAFYISAVIFLFYVLSIVDFNMLNEERIGHAIVDEEIADKLNSNYIAGRFAVAVYVGYYLIYRLKKKSSFLRGAYIGISLLMIYIVLVSGSRTSFGILILPFLINMVRNSKNIINAVFITVIIMLAGYYVIMEIPYFYEIIGSRIEDAINVASGNETGYEDISRKTLIVLGFGWFLDNPIIGHGINTFRELADSTFYFGGRHIYAHNNYIELLVDLGGIGVVFYYSAHYYLFRCYKSLKNGQLQMILQLLLVAILFSDFFWVGYFNDISQFMLCMAFVVANIGKEQTDKYKFIKQYDKSRHYPAR